MQKSNLKNYNSRFKIGNRPTRSYTTTIRHSVMSCVATTLIRGQGVIQIVATQCSLQMGNFDVLRPCKKAN